MLGQALVIEDRLGNRSRTVPSVDNDGAWNAALGGLVTSHRSAGPVTHDTKE